MLTLPRLCVGRVKLSVMRAHTHTPQAHSSTRHLFPPHCVCSFSSVNASQILHYNKDGETLCCLFIRTFRLCVLGML